MKKLLFTFVTLLGLVCFGCSAQKVDDSAVTTKVKSKLAADANTSAIKIKVETTDGVVTLSGAVPTTTEKAEAERVARDTQGVTRVINQIVIDPNATGATSARR